jgi:hypothetical protein
MPLPPNDECIATCLGRLRVQDNQESQNLTFTPSKKTDVATHHETPSPISTPSAESASGPNSPLLLNTNTRNSGLESNIMNLTPSSHRRFHSKLNSIANLPPIKSPLTNPKDRCRTEEKENQIGQSKRPEWDSRFGVSLTHSKLPIPKPDTPRSIDLPGDFRAR